MFLKIFIAGMIFSVSSLNVMAQSPNNVDYDKPFDQIKEQSMFDRSHSLMPTPEVINTTPNVVVPPTVEPVVLNSEVAPVQVLDSVASSQVTNVEPVSPSGIQNMKAPVVNQEKVEIKAMNEPVVRANVNNFNNVDVSAQTPVVNSPTPIWQNNSFEMREATPNMVQEAAQQQMMMVQPQQQMVQQPMLMQQEMPTQAQYQNNMIQQPVVMQQQAVEVNPYQAQTQMMGQPNLMVNHPMQPVQNNYPVVNDMSDSYRVGATPYDNMKMENPIVLKRPEKQTEVQPVKVIKQDVIEEVVYEAPARPVQKTYVTEEVVGPKAKAHIASYVNNINANEGIAVYKSKYPRMDMFEASVKYEEVPNKGWFYRVYLLGDEKELDMLCREMKSHGDWCKVFK